MENYGKLFLWLSALALIIGNVTKRIIPNAVMIAFFLALIFSSIAFVILYEAKK